MRLKKKIMLIIALLIVFSGVSCSSQWSFLIRFAEKEFEIKKIDINESQYLKNGEGNCEGVPLEIILYQNGINTVNSIEIIDQDQNVHAYSWGKIANEACISKKGNIFLAGEVMKPEVITVIPSQYNDLHTSLLDIFPTTMSALDIEIDDGSYRKPLIEINSNHVVLIFLDGFNYDHYISALEKGLLAEFRHLEINEPVLTVFPPRTTVATAAIITGKNPINNGVFKSGIRQTSEKTMFDFCVENGLSVISVEGESLPFNLTNSDVILSGDRDMNGGTDDNVFSNVVSTIESGIPNLFYIHFHGIDDLGHTYGPDSAEVWEKIEEIDGYLSEIIQLLPEDCMVITFADHGMHDIGGEKDRGNHGNLIDEDMVVFINILIT